MVSGRGCAVGPPAARGRRSPARLLFQRLHHREGSASHPVGLRSHGTMLGSRYDTMLNMLITKEEEQLLSQLTLELGGGLPLLLQPGRRFTRQKELCL